jgi:pantoate--beta-alanine ligase
VKILRTIDDVRRLRKSFDADSTIGFVPTMGAFHAGHAALFRAAREVCDGVIVSLFVNPTQFTVSADLEGYPRDEPRDVRLAESTGIDALYAPAAGEIYPPGFATWVTVDGPAAGFEGEARPGHFRGVATICLKLFSIVDPHVAFFGQKDAQQVAIIKRLVGDLNLRVEIRVLETVRDHDGLALSSRNIRLSVAERAEALAIPRALDAGLVAHRHGGDAVSAARAMLGRLKVDYVSIAEFDGQPTLVIAAWSGRTRLIDNVRLDAGATPDRP